MWFYLKLISQTSCFLDINQLEENAPRSFVKIEPVTLNEDSLVPSCYKVSTLPNLTDHELVRGPAIQNKDVKLTWGKFLGYRSSGVMGK